MYQFLNVTIYTASIIYVAESSADVDVYQPRGMISQTFINFDDAAEWILSEIRELDYDLGINLRLIPGFDELSDEFKELAEEEPIFSLKYLINQDAPHLKAELDLYIELIEQFLKEVLATQEIITTAGEPVVYYSIKNNRLQI